MIIKKAEFVISNTEPDLCPITDKPEFAFVGRSNVGKSSLINMLTGFGDPVLLQKDGEGVVCRDFPVRQ